MCFIDWRLKLSSDEPFLYELYCNNRRDEAERWGFTDTEISAFLWIQYQLRKRHYDHYYPESEQYILMCNQKKIGTFILAKQAEQWVLVDIGILDSYQNQGLGTDVLLHLIDQFKRVDANIFKLSILKNSRAVKWYKRLGFTIGSEHEIHLKMLISK